MKRRALLGALVALALFAAPAAARRHHATRPVDELSRAQAQLREQQAANHRKLAAAREKAAALAHQEHAALSQLSEIQQALDRKKVELADSQFRLQRTSQQLVATRQQLNQAQDGFHQQQQLAATRLRAIYKHRDVDYWEAILTAPDLGSFLSKYEYFRHVAMQDASILDELSRRRERISREQQHFDHQLQVISAVTTDISNQKEQIQQKSVEQATIVQRLRTDRQYYDAYVRQLEQDDRQIEGMIRRLLEEQRRRYAGQNAPYMGKGFIWPASGPIMSPFGYRRHPIFGKTMFHSGVDIGAPYGAPIVAADNGVVLFCGWYGGYGQAVVVDHGGGLQTLYGHTSRYIVSAGQRLTRGQVIAYVGATGWATGPHLHFGVFKNGSPVNPLGYLH